MEDLSALSERRYLPAAKERIGCDGQSLERADPSER
jgi:hypothetical protein